MSSHPDRRSFPRLLALLAAVLTAPLLEGCGELPDERGQAAMSSFRIRNFKAPGQPIAQVLDPGGRCFVFLELSDVESGTPFEIDPEWTFEVTITGPDGAAVPLLVDPWIPSAWANDDGVRLVGAFEAERRGSYQIDITSPNCPSRTSPMVLLPVN